MVKYKHDQYYKLVGKVRGFDERTMKGMPFESARVLIITETMELIDGHVMELIDGHVNFVLGDHMVLVRVRRFNHVLLPLAL